MTDKMSVITTAFGVLLAAVIAAVGWIARKAWKRIQKEREMLYELYGFVFGAEEIDMNMDDDPVEDKLDRGTRRFEDQAETLDRYGEKLDRLDENVCRIADALDDDIELSNEDQSD